MSTPCDIDSVTIDGSVLFVQSRLSKADHFTHIYRDASGIEWDDTRYALCAAESDRWNHFDLYKQMLAAVHNEYGRDLVVAPTTRWLNVPTELRARIEAYETTVA